MKHLYDIGSRVNAVINQNRSMHKLADTGRSSHGLADIGKGSQDINVIQNCIAESGGRLWKVCPGVGDDFVEVG